ncbi:MAG: hypothetical protein SGJ20_10765 [Planctomycetota bacterium]|nr:hypothetical protein [Planctomycetota bacterium]
MPTLRLRRLLPSLLSRSLIVVASLVYIAQACGVQITFPANAKDLSVAFPCMHRNCGCMNADQCWRSCCCNSVKQRLDWATKHNVTPPADAIAQAVAEEKKASENNMPSGDHCCSQTGDACDNAASRSGCTDNACSVHGSNTEDSTNSAASTCCDSEHTENDSTTAGDANESTPTGICLLQAFRCGGAGDNWLGAAASLIPPTADVTIIVPFLTRIVVQDSPGTISFRTPPVPPPRLALA